MSGGQHRTGAPAEEPGTTVDDMVERTRSDEHPPEDPSGARRAGTALPPAPYGAVPPPLAAPASSALAGHPTSQPPDEIPHRPRPSTRASPLGTALPPPVLPPTPDSRPEPSPRPPAVRAGPASEADISAAENTQLIPTLPPVPTTFERSDVHRAPSGPGEEPPGGNRGILRSAGTMAVASLVSRITGFLRTIVLTAALGTAAVGNAYSVSNTLPNIIYELLLGGVLTSVIVPLLVHAQERDRDGGVGYAQRLTTIALTGLSVMTVLAVLAAPLLTRVYGIVDDPDQVALANWLARILLVEIVFYGLGALAMGILNSRGVFGWPAWAPVLNNVVVIATAILFVLAGGPGDLTPVTITATQVWLLGGGTTVGIAVQAVVLVPQLRKVGVPLRPRWGLRGTGLGEAGSLGLWVIGYVAISQVGVLVATNVANTAARSQALGPLALANAGLLFQMPYGIIGVALLTALVPRMSRAASRGDVPGVVADLSLGTRLSALGLLPVTALLTVLGPELGAVAFGHGETTAAQARGIGTALAVGAFGLLPMAVTLLQLRVFYAMKDARTPTMIQLAMIAVRVPLLLLVPVLVGPEQVVAGLMVATSLTYVAGWVVGYLALRRRLGTLRTGDAAPTVLKLAAVSVFAGLVGWGAAYLTTRLAGTSFAGSLVTLIVGTVVIGAVVVGGVVLAKVPEVAGPVAAIRVRLGRTRH